MPLMNHRGELGNSLLKKITSYKDRLQKMRQLSLHPWERCQFNIIAAHSAYCSSDSQQYR